MKNNFRWIGRIPLLVRIVRRGGCATQNMLPKATLTAQTGWSLSTKWFGNAFPKHGAVRDHPVRSIKGRFGAPGKAWLIS